MQLRRLSRVFRKRLWSYVLTRCQRFAFQSPNVSKNGDKRNGHTFDPLGSNVSILSSNNQLLALHNGCQEVVSKGGLDRFVRLSRPSITLTFNTLEANNKNQQLSRGSKPLNTRRHITGNTLMITSNFCQQESRIRFLLCIGPGPAWPFKTVRGNISFLRPPRNCFEISLLLHITGQCLQNERKPYQRNVFVNKNTS